MCAACPYKCAQRLHECKENEKKGSDYFEKSKLAAMHAHVYACVQQYIHLPQEFKKSSRAARGSQFLNIIRKN